MCINKFEIFQLIIDALMPIITIVAFIFGLNQYRRTQKWKRQEFLANVVKDFFSDFYVSQALSMLDWHKLELKHEPNSDKTFTYYRDNLGEALDTEEIRKEKRPLQNPLFDNDEVTIRFSFDKLLYFISSFQCHIENGLYKKEDIEPYIIYYLRIIGERNKYKRIDDRTRFKLWEFMKFYDYKNVIKFMNLYNFNYQKVKKYHEEYLTEIKSTT